MKQLDNYLEFDRVTKSFGNVDVVKQPFTLGIKRNEFVVFLGPSGCGKTTLMRMVGGLDHASTGTIRLDEKPVGPPDWRRGMVFQSYSSFPWLTVAQNVEYGMRFRKDLSVQIKKDRTRHYLQLVGLTEFASAFPSRISGGMRQRTAIARTLASGSEILLMDEPFGALDAQRREALQVELRAIQQRDAKTIIFVTHDVEEAVYLADRIIVFSSRPTRIVKEMNISSILGVKRSLELRDTIQFFEIRNELLRLLRQTDTSH